MIEEFTVTIARAYETFIQDSKCSLWYNDQEIEAIEYISLLRVCLYFYDAPDIELWDSEIITVVRKA